MTGTEIGPASGGADRRPGDTLDVVAKWSLGDAPASLEARLFWYTSGKGTQDIGVVESQPIEVTGAHGEQRVRFRLPDAPYSFSGQLITLAWAVELVANQGENEGEVARWEFVMAPDGREVMLGGDGYASMEGADRMARLAARTR